jgi:hypothetical protein
MLAITSAKAVVGLKRCCDNFLWFKVDNDVGGWDYQ